MKVILKDKTIKLPTSILFNKVVYKKMDEVLKEEGIHFEFSSLVKIGRKLKKYKNFTFIEIYKDDVLELKIVL